MQHEQTHSWSINRCCQRQETIVGTVITIADDLHRVARCRMLHLNTV